MVLGTLDSEGRRYLKLVGPSDASAGCFCVLFLVIFQVLELLEESIHFVLQLA